MPVETKTSNLFMDARSDYGPIDPIVTRGYIQSATGEVDNAADAEAGSTYRLCELPSDCMIDPSSFVVVDGWGYGSVRIGTVDDDDALVSTTRSAAAVHYPVVAGDARYDKRLWQLLGLPKDPGGVIALYAHGIAAPTVAGKLRFRINAIRNA